MTHHVDGSRVVPGGRPILGSTGSVNQLCQNCGNPANVCVCAYQSPVYVPGPGQGVMNSGPFGMPPNPTPYMPSDVMTPLSAMSFQVPIMIPGTATSSHTTFTGGYSTFGQATFTMPSTDMNASTRMGLVTALAKILELHEVVQWIQQRWMWA